MRALTADADSDSTGDLREINAVTGEAKGGSAVDRLADKLGVTEEPEQSRLNGIYLWI